MKLTDKKLLTLALLAAVAAAAVATAGCGDRSPVWSASASVNASYGLNGGVAILDAPADRVVLLLPGADQSLRIEHVSVGRHILNVQRSPLGNKLLVLSAGHRAALGDDEPDEKPSLTVIACGDGVSTQRYELTTLTDPLGRHRDRPRGRTLGGLVSPIPASRRRSSRIRTSWRSWT